MLGAGTRRSAVIKKNNGITPCTWGRLEEDQEENRVIGECFQDHIRCFHYVQMMNQEPTKNWNVNYVEALVVGWSICCFIKNFVFSIVSRSFQSHPLGEIVSYSSQRKRC